MKRKKFPLKIKQGNTVVTVYKSQIAGKPRYRVCYYENERPKYVTFSDPTSAENHANEVAKKLTRNEVNVLTFSRGGATEVGRGLTKMAQKFPCARWRRCSVSGRINEWCKRRAVEI